VTEPLDITVQATPNPNAAKFTLNRTVAAQGTTYRDAAEPAPEWATQILGIAGVTQVFALNTFVTVNKTAEGDWNQIAPQVAHVLQQAFA
jgi:hypothetical protein